MQHALGIIATSTTAVFDRSDQQELVIQVTALFAYSWLAARLQDFADCYPDIRLHVHLGEYTEDFIRYKTDLQISYGPGPWEKAYSDRLFGEVIFPVALPEVCARITEPEDLLAFPLLEVQQHNLGWFQALQNLGLASRPEPRWRFVQNTPLAFSFAAASPAVALARAPASDELQERYGLRRCLKDHPSLQGLHEYSLRHAGVDRLSPAAAVFRDWLLAQLPH
ncbi:LysR substrate-binding domain-containing protein [Rhodovibrionaceae bacterium A322]